MIGPGSDKNHSWQFVVELLEIRSRTIKPWSIQSISQFPINRYNNPFYTFDLWLRPWWKHLTSQVPGQRSVFVLSLIFGRPVRLPVGKHPGWADQTPESVPCLKLFVNITCLANMILSIAIYAAHRPKVRLDSKMYLIPSSRLQIQTSSSLWAPLGVLDLSVPRC